jgi:hypothetical protein
MICWRCQKEQPSIKLPERNEVCPRCGASFRSCSNCEFYDELADSKCRESKAPPVEDKERATFCPFFHVAVTPHRLPPRPVTRESLKEKWDSLFKD